ncbi:MAG: hypothetical protein IKR69_01575 [Bacteroidales bacterium]|nr:hypothetical protein [Bacteroidales bacterium]
MKKILSAIAFTAVIAVSCSKELNKDVETIPEGEVNIVRISASIDDGLKTAYANEKTFSWVKNDLIRVLCSDGSNSSFANFTAESAGASSTFYATITDWYRPSGLAFYPTSIAPSVSGGKYTVSIPQDFSAPVNNPLSGLPIIGVPDSNGSAYSFSSATGILKFTVNNVPDEAAWFSIYTNTTNQSLCGNFTIGDDNVIYLSNYAGTGNTEYYSHISPDSNGTAVLYVPVPVGTIKAGLKIVIEDNSINSLFEIETKQDIEVKRNTVLELKPIECPTVTWNSLGTGKFYDSYIGMSADDFIEVEIEQNADEPNSYRIVNPYGIIYNSADADSYLTFDICSAGDQIGYSDTNVPFDGIVSFNSHFTGYNMSSSGSDYLYIRSINDYSGVRSDLIIHSLVVKTKADGSPANIQLAPIYYGSSSGVIYWGYSDNDLVQIAMPGEDFIDENYLEVSAAFIDCSEGKANIAVSLGEGLDYAEVGISAISFDDAAANVNTKVTSSSTVSLDLPSEYGTFYIFTAGELNNYLFSSSLDQFSIAPSTIPDEYYNWIGSWSVDDGTDADIWEIAADEDGISYIIYGLWGYSFIPTPATFNSDNSISINYGAVYGSYYLYGLYYSDNYYLSSVSPVMIGVLSDDTGTSATLNGGNDNGLEIVGYYLTDSSHANYGWRDLPSIMTKNAPSPTAPAVRSSSVKTPKVIDSRKPSLEKNSHLTEAPARKSSSKR